MTIRRYIDDVGVKTGDNVLAIILNDIYYDSSSYLVQYGGSEEGCCFPGGNIRFGENPRQATYRELKEQYGFDTSFYKTIVFPGKSLKKQSTSPPVTFFQPCCICQNGGGIISEMSCAEDDTDFSIDPSTAKFAFRNLKYEKKKLRWCSIKDLYQQSIYSKEILDSIFDVLAMHEDEGSAGDWVESAGDYYDYI